MSVVNEILLHSFLILLCAGGGVGLFIGAVMLLKPERIARWNQYFSRWVSADRIEEQLDRPRWIERLFYRHHRPVGGFLLVGAIFVLYMFLFPYNARKISAEVAPGYWWLVDALMALLLIGAVLAALVGAVVLARPSLLREIEKPANRWIATEDAAKLLNGMRYSLDQQILRHGKVAGALMILGSLYILTVLVPFLWRGGWKF